MSPYRVWIRLCLIVIALAAVPAWGGDGANTAGSTLTPPAGLIAPMQAISMPDFRLPSVAGMAVGAADLRGKVILVRFWSPW